MIALIAAMDENRVIGYDNRMPWHLPADLKHFKKITLGKPIVMGRKTFESIGCALPGRRNIVISRNPHYQASGCELATSFEAALALVGDAPEVMIIGGAAIFERALSMADRLYLTRIQATFEGDTYFPAWDTADWQEVSSDVHPPDEHNAYALTFITLDRINKDPK